MSVQVDDSEHLAPRRINAVVDLIEFAGRLTPSTAVVPGGHRVEDLRLVESARDHGIVDRIILVGDKGRILSGVTQVGIEIARADIVPADGDEAIAAATVELIKTRSADIVLKGDISTPVINRHMLPLAVRPTVSLATVFDAAPIASGRPMVMTDPGVTTACNFGRMVDLVHNAVDVARVVGIERPRVAILSANEKQVPSLPSTRIGIELARRPWPHAVVCGPLSFDLATDPGSAVIKGLPDLPGAAEVAGRADVLVCPGIDAANILYKTIAAMNKYGQASLASVTVGFPVPYVILSRSDSLETRLVSIALCSVYARHRSNEARMPGASAAPVDIWRRPAGDATTVGWPPKHVALIVARLDRRPTIAAVRGAETIDGTTVVLDPVDLEHLQRQPAGSDPQADRRVGAVADRVAKAIGGTWVAAGCDVEAIVVTGELAGNKRLVTLLRRRVGRLAPVMVVESWPEPVALATEPMDVLSKSTGDVSDE